MKILPKELVEKTQHEISLFSEDHAGREIKRIGKSQPHLLSFIAERTKDLDSRIIETFMKIFLAVYGTYEKGRKKIDQIADDELRRTYNENLSLFQSIESAHKKFYERRMALMVSVQPYLMEYVLETLNQTLNEEPCSTKNKEDCGYVYLLIMTIIDVLDMKAVY